MLFNNKSFFGNRFAQVFNQSWIEPDPKKKVEAERRLNHQSLQPLNPESGAQIIDNGLYNSPTLAVEASYQNSAALVNEYRAMALDPDVDLAIDDIINAAIVTSEEEKSISINLEKTDLSESVKKEITEEFDYIMDLLDIEQTGYEKMRSWYIDGRQYVQLIVDPDDTKEGVQAISMLDPRAMKRIKEVERKIDPDTRIDMVQDVEEYYIYNPSWAVDQTATASIAAPGIQSPQSVSGRMGPSQVLKLPLEMVAFVHSGILSSDGSLVFSNLEKARKPLNNLKMLRDALVIYWITRAPERRVFYVDVGSLPRKAAAEYVQEYMNKNRTKVAYDPTTGKVQGNAYQQTMLEDFWMPRREGGRGTEISTIGGNSNGLGDTDQLYMFQNWLFRSLNVPVSRMEGDDNASMIFGGNNGEMTRDELKFFKFVQRLRRRYCGLFKSILRVHLNLKGICTNEEWDDLEKYVMFDFASDTHLKEQQENQNMINKLGALSQADQFVGKYFTRDWVKRTILKQTEEEIAEQKELMDQEREEDNNNEFDKQSLMATVPAPDPNDPFKLITPQLPKGNNKFRKDSPSSGSGAIQPDKPSGGEKTKQPK